MSTGINGFVVPGNTALSFTENTAFSVIIYSKEKVTGMYVELVSRLLDKKVLTKRPFCQDITTYDSLLVLFYHYWFWESNGKLKLIAVKKNELSLFLSS